jgi:hypothetical protein
MGKTGSFQPHARPYFYANKAELGNKEGNPRL